MPTSPIVSLLRAGIEAWNAQIRAARKNAQLLRPDLAVCVCAHKRGSHCDCGECSPSCAHCGCDKFEETIQ